MAAVGVCDRQEVGVGVACTAGACESSGAAAAASSLTSRTLCCALVPSGPHNGSVPYARPKRARFTIGLVRTVAHGALSVCYTTKGICSVDVSLISGGNLSAVRGIV